MNSATMFPTATAKCFECATALICTSDSDFFFVAAEGHGYCGAIRAGHHASLTDKKHEKCEMKFEIIRADGYNIKL